MRHKLHYTPFVLSLSKHEPKSSEPLPFDKLRANGKCKEALDALH